MVINACQQVLAGGWNMACENFSYATSGAASIGYKISNYMLGGIFRGIVMGEPSYTDSTLQSCERLLTSDILMNNSTHQKVLDAFEMRTEYFEFWVGRVSYRLKVKCYESRNRQNKHTCVRVGGKDETAEVSDLRVYPLLKAYIITGRANMSKQGLRVFQLPLHDHQIKNQGGNTWHTWKPAEAREVSRVFFAFLKNLQDFRNIDVDSLMCHSLGSLVLENLDSENAQLPQLLILDRALPSLWKVGCKLYNRVTASLLYGGAYVAGWAADPEKRLMQFFEKSSQQMSLSGRRVVVIEVKDDWYFSGPGAFSEGFTKDLNKMGAQSYRKCFHPNEIAYHSRAHHALSLGKLKNNHIKDEALLPLDPYESAASAIIQRLMLPDKRL